jgi:hypothetical protein
LGAAQRTCEEGARMLANIAEQYLKSSQGEENGEFMLNELLVREERKPIFEEKENRDLQCSIEKTQDKRYYSFSKQEHQLVGANSYPQDSKKKRKSEVEELTESLKKLDLEFEAD